MTQRDSPTTYAYPDTLTFESVGRAPTANPPAAAAVDIVAHWYNDYGLDKTALAADEAAGWYGWYDWRWNFPSNAGDGVTTLGYDESRHPLQGFYKGDDPDVLDWQCYWLAKAGVTAVSIEKSDGFSSASWSDPEDAQHWVYELFHNVPNFSALKYVLWLKTSGTTTEIEAQNDDVANIYDTYPGAYTYEDGGTTYAVVFAWSMEAIRGVYDNFSGQSNTVQYLKDLAAKFQAVGYGGVMVLARQGGVVTASPDASLAAAGVWVVDADYEGRYGTDADHDNDYGTYATSVEWPTDADRVVNVVTSAESVYPHPSSMALAGSTPEAFGDALDAAVSSVVANGQPSIVTIYNVSEWAEAGPGLLPNRRDGFGYLQAVLGLPRS